MNRSCTDYGLHGADIVVYPCGVGLRDLFKKDSGETNAMGIPTLGETTPIPALGHDPSTDAAMGSVPAAPPPSQAPTGFPGIVESEPVRLGSGVPIFGRGSVVNASGTPLGGEIVEALSKHMAEAQANGNVWTAKDTPALSGEILGAMAKSGFDPSKLQGMAGMAGMAPRESIQPPGAAGALPGAPPAADDTAQRLDQLEQLGKLHEQGILTDAEFADQKKRILGES